ncbi:helix-turn-helix domain-containing protein [Natrialba sp. SSL1]|uniref:helix-turn-helix domain-containing protein n=1 Tax=Natrialba sp. SSL1 TaxID=1869245 RepID=UPI00209B16E2|nr:helix-turn-helix domain-containing protein [Natrialba sp. SSL1]
MTEHGDKIPNLTTERVREKLADERDPKAIKRLTAAREYLERLSPAQIEDKYGWSRQTIYNWLNRFEERGFEAALYDDPKSGRSPKLDDDQFDRFADALQEPPTEVGYNDPVWSS